MIKFVDAVIGIDKGDESKGKISKRLIDTENYKNCIRYSGGSNAGHSVYADGQKYVTHLLSSGIYNKSTNVIIGPGCCINLKKFFDEYDKFYNIFDLKDRMFISSKCHIITDKNLEDDGKDIKIGTTRQGIGPCYVDKYNRTGIRLKDIKDQEFESGKSEQYNDRFTIKDVYMEQDDFYHNKCTKFSGNCLLEGSQGMQISIDSDSYPYCTSSHLHPGHFFTTFNMPVSLLRNVYAVCKVYSTYSGFKEQPFEYIFKKGMESLIRDIGQEVGETTGRPRKIGVMNLDKIIHAVKSIGGTHVIFNKMDVLRQIPREIELNPYRFVFNRELKTYRTPQRFLENLERITKVETGLNKIIFSETKDGSDITNAQLL